MRERPRLTVRRGRDEAPFLRGSPPRLSEPGLVSPQNKSNMKGSHSDTHSRFLRERSGDRLQSYWGRIAGLAKETFKGLLSISDGLRTAQNVRSITTDVIETPSRVSQSPPSVHEAPRKTESLALDPSRQSYPCIDTSRNTQHNSTIFNETTFHNAPPPLPSPSPFMSAQPGSQFVYNFYYMNSGFPPAPSVAPVQMLQPEFITQSSPAWSRRSILARRPASVKREREGQENPTTSGSVAKMGKLPHSSVTQMINESSNTFPISNISYRTSLNTSYSNDTAIKRTNTNNELTQESSSKRHAPVGEQTSTVAQPPFFHSNSTTNGTTSTISNLGGFVKSGPPAVIPEDDGFASNAGSDDDEDKDKMASVPTSSKPFTFGAGSSLSKPLGGLGTAAVTSAPPNPFSFGSATKEASTQNATISNLGGFVKSGPPAVIPEDDGFASNAGSDDEDKDKMASVPTSSKPFTFGAGSSLSKPLGGLGTAAVTSAPPNPFSFGGNSSSATAPADKPAAPPNPFSFGSATKEASTQNATISNLGGFVKSGPPAVIPEDDGFASNAGSDDDEDKDKMASVPTSSKPFTFGAGSSLSKPLGGLGTAAVTSAPPNPFSFGGNSRSATAPADKPAAPPNPFSFGGNSSSATAPADKPAAPPNPFSFGGNSSSATAPADKPAAPPNPFSFGGNSSSATAPADKPAAPPNPFSFGGNSSSATAPADKPAAPPNPFSFGGNSSSATAPADKPAAPPNPFSFGGNSSSATAPADKPAAPPNPFSFGGNSSSATAPADKPAAPPNPFSFGGNSSSATAPADKPAAPPNPFSFGGNSSSATAPADKPAAPPNPFSFGGNSSSATAPADKPAAPPNPFSFGGNSSSATAPADKPAAPPNPFSFGGNSSSATAPADKPAAPPNPFSFGGNTNSNGGSVFSKNAFRSSGAGGSFPNAFAACRREEIQKKIELLRLEREREKMAFDELALTNTDMTPAEIAEAARRKAMEDEPTSLEVGNVTVSVGDYVYTLEDVYTMEVAESGIFVPDPIKRLYLGERGKITRVMPSFQGKKAVEMVFADGSVKVFLTECLAVGCNAKLRRNPPQPVSAKATHVDPKAICVPEIPEYVPPPKPDPLPQPTWSTLAMPFRKADPKVKKLELKDPLNSSPIPTTTTTTPTPSITTTTTTITNSIIPIDTTTTTASTVREEKTEALVPLKTESKSEVSEESHGEVSRKTSSILTSQSKPAAVGSKFRPIKIDLPANTDQSIGLVKEVLSGGQRRKVSAGEGLGSPIQYDVEGGEPLIGCGDNDNLLQTPRVDLMATCRSSKGEKKPLVNSTKDKVIPAHCPEGYKKKFSLSDKTTKIPRFGPEPATAETKHCQVAGALPNATDLHFHSIIFPKNIDAMDGLFSMLTRELKWDFQGYRARRLFTTDGVEITEMDDIQNGMLFVVTPGHIYHSETVTKSKVRNPTPAMPSGTLKTERTIMMPKPSRTKAATVTAASISSEASDPMNNGKKFDGHQMVVKKGGSSLPTATATVPKSDPIPSEQQLCKSVAGKGIVKPISVRVFSNGEYGDMRYDRLPFRTVTLRPIHKTMRAVINTIERELEWNSLGKKVEKIYDATGSEITMIEELSDGQAIVVSTGDRFVVPHPSSVLHHDVMKLMTSSKPSPVLGGGNQ